MPISSKQRFFRSALGALITILALAMVSSAQETATAEQNVNTSVQPIKIKNFGQMDGRFYRGAQPGVKDYKDLAALGINTVIDLRDDPQQTEKSLVESVGMKYVHIPMVAKKYPTPEVTEAFLKTVNDPATGKFFVHCAGGRHRTGVVGAVYRFTRNNWSYDQVMAEMNEYEFGSGMGHGKQKDFVKDYWKEFQTKQVAVRQ